jgi:geranylgeranyl pyrophosphate synthase
MRYSTLEGGKRVRAILVYASGLALGAPLARLDTVAAAIECIHAYSLIHDDLPAMDDDALRRGKPTNHIAFDEATAILAGDALQALAFELIASESNHLTDAQSRKIAAVLARACGRDGMVGGQQRDIDATGQQLTREQLEQVHREKTGALIRSAVIAGALCSDQFTESAERALSIYAEKLGLAFQVIDDVLDVESSTEQLGKVSGADAASGKVTYPELIGLEESHKLATKLHQQAIESLAPIGDNTQYLLEVAELIVKRKH